ncbi:cupredoxin domain-containing protein [Aestuariimicrobium ganziense]|uniref:cupredoxin domain-containing protein n=1 Tax=Aestuariimicrobium ganziense TaxID=2773677 RepID=UPI001F1FA36C|nr:cupredoxin domain-containing protein [Aestuariimicrobium ganziense]
MTRVAVVVLALLVVLTGCSGSSKAPQTATMTIVIADGSVSPNGQRVEVRKGGTVTLEVTTDKATIIHVHGYEIEVQANPGAPTTHEFTADKPGAFEIETHDPAVIVGQLVVKS